MTKKTAEKATKKTKAPKTKTSKTKAPKTKAPKTKVAKTKVPKNKATKDKSSSSLEVINSKLTETKKDLENQVEDLSIQVKKLGKKSGNKALKMLQQLDESYQARLLSLQAEFEEGLATLSKVHDKVLERIPEVVAEKITSIESGIAKSIQSVTTTTKKTATKPRAKVATKVSKPKPKAAPKKPTIASIKGIGPVMQKKLAGKGITSLEDIANTPKSKIEVLKQFENERGFNTWKEQAKGLLAKA